jgi:polar amino acid transport system permease protein
MRLRSTLISSGLVVLAVAVLVVVIGSSPGWPRVQETFFSWEHAKASFPLILDGFWLNVKLFMICEVFILLLGLAVALARTARSPWLAPIRVAAVVYTDLFRGIPTILLILLLGFGVPALRLQGLPTDPFLWAGVALVLSYGAYVAEVYRAGIESIHPSQTAAARSLGLRRGQAMRHVVLPQAVRRVIPPLLNDFIGLQKDTVLVSFVGVVEVFRQSQIRQAGSFNFTPYIATALIFLALTIPLARLTDWLVARDRSRGSRGAVLARGATTAGGAR